VQYHFVFGSYVPSYLLIKIQIPDSLANITNLAKVDQAVFLHEYTHFLQNISGGFGHAHIWNTYDQLRQLLSDEQMNPADEIKIPIRNEVATRQRLFMKTLRTVSGNKFVPDGIDDKTALVSSVKLVKDADFEKLNPGSNIWFLNLRLRDNKNNVADYLFGDTAVSETMAYLMEKKFFGGEEINNFPYRSCQKLGEWMGTTLLENDEWLFALCDVAMLTSYPGRMFYQILLEMYQRDFLPDVAEHIYDYGLRLMYQNGWRVWDDFENNKNGAKIVLSDLIQHPIFIETVEWFKYILESGYQSRINNQYFMLELYRAADPYSGMWKNVMAQFGTPQIHNALGERFFSAPIELKKLEEKIEPLFLLSLQQINNTLMFGQAHCDLYRCCEKAPNIEEDERCKTAPWERAKDEKKCAYGSLWKLYDFAKKKVTLEEK
jgi:hypothetical protein